MSAGKIGASQGSYEATLGGVPLLPCTYNQHDAVGELHCSFPI